MFTTFFAEKKKSVNHRFLGNTCNVSIVQKIDQHVVFVSLLIIEAFLWDWHSCGKRLVLLYCRPGVVSSYLRLLHCPVSHTHGRFMSFHDLYNQIKTVFMPAPFHMHPFVHSSVWQLLAHQLTAREFIYYVTDQHWKNQVIMSCVVLV